LQSGDAPVDYDPERNDFQKQAEEAESKARLTTDHDLKRSWKDHASGWRFMAETLELMKTR
jgi:hypothetical protein